MTEIAYEPPEREFNDTLLAFRDMQMRDSMSAMIEPDPLGDVNRIVTLVRNTGSRQHRIKSVLCRVPKGAEVELVYENTPTTTILDSDWAPIHRWAGRHVWAVKVDGKRVIEVPDSETHPPTLPRPTVPLSRRLRSWATKLARSAADGLAGRLGYHRAGECGGWDE
jgi:hypothetical protein